MNSALWDKLSYLIENSNKSITVYKGNNSSEEIEYFGINEDSLMGVIISQTSGIVVDNYIRIIGQKCSDRKGLIEYNKLQNQLTDGMIVIAFDIVGGIFAINQSRFSESQMDVWYFAPDTLEWECLEMTYPQFISWLINGDTDTFYENMRWGSWKNDCKNVSFDKVIHIYPFLWSKECIIENASKKVVAFEELANINFDFAQKLLKKN